MKAINYLILLAASVFIFSSCTKEVQGPTGLTGPQGPQGPSSSYAVTIDSAAPNQSPNGAWNFNSTTGAYNIVVYPVNGLASPNNSIVEVYYSDTYNSFSNWYELPVTNSLSNTGTFNFYYTTYSVYVQYTAATAPTAELYFKVVVITQP